jgi:hypothetical protein
MAFEVRDLMIQALPQKSSGKKKAPKPPPAAPCKPKPSLMCDAPTYCTKPKTSLCPKNTYPTPCPTQLTKKKASEADEQGLRLLQRRLGSILAARSSATARAARLHR